MLKSVKKISSQVISSPFKFLWNSIGAVFAILLFGKNFLGMNVEKSIYFGIFIYVLVIGIYLGFLVIRESIIALHGRFVDSVWGSAIIVLKESYAEIHYLQKTNYDDNELVETLQTLCDNMKKLFDKKTKGDCSVSIKVPIQEYDNLESVEFRNLCRDNAHRQRNTEQYQKTRHTVIGNTPYTHIVNHLTNGQTSMKTLAYVNNDIRNSGNYMNTSQPCYPNGVFPYQSELVYPIIPMRNVDNKYTMCGFICIDCDRKYAFDNTPYEIDLIQGVADEIYGLIVSRIYKVKNQE